MEGIVYSYHVNRLRYKVDIDIKFGLYILKTRNFLKQVETLCEGSGKRYVLSLTKFKELEITYPDNKAEQQRISEIIYSIDSELDQLENKLEKYKLAKQGMMQQLLTGKIRIL
jgi:type I restriction enzyme S subunit